MVDVGPNSEAGSDARSEVGRTSVGAPSATLAGERVTTLLDDLAKVVARAVADGEMDLALGLLEVARRRGAPAGVVNLADARAKKGDG
ncbi:MAG: hypothetical protein ACHREM_22005 [Polyangiales bacterium]